MPELDMIQIIKEELLCVKHGVWTSIAAAPLFDVSQIDFMLESLRTL